MQFAKVALCVGAIVYGGSLMYKTVTFDEQFKPKGRQELENLRVQASNMRKSNVSCETISNTISKFGDEITKEYKLTEEEKVSAVKVALKQLENC